MQTGLSKERLERFRQLLDIAASKARHRLRMSPERWPQATRAGQWIAPRSDLSWADGYWPAFMWVHSWLAQQPEEQAFWQQQGSRLGEKLNRRAGEPRTAGLGRIFLTSHLPWYRTSSDRNVCDVIIQAGRSLATRFHHEGRFIATPTEPNCLDLGSVADVGIIYFTSNQTLDQDISRTVTSHCRTVRDCLIDSDGLLKGRRAHFDPTEKSFEVLSDPITAQDVAWTILGYMRVFFQSNIREFLKIAQALAERWLDQLGSPALIPSSLEPAAQTPTDSAATAMLANSLLDLAAEIEDQEVSQRFRDFAWGLLDGLTESCVFVDEIERLELLTGACYREQENHYADESVVWGDYYLFETLAKLVLTAD